MWYASDFKLSDLDGMLDLTRDYYGDVDISDKHFIEWEYFNNPSGSSIIKVARNELDKVVGQYVLLSMNVKAFNKIEKATLSLNTLTNTNYLRQGIFSLLSEKAFCACVEDEYAFTYGFPNQNSYPGFITKLGFTDISSVPLLIYPCSIRSLVKKRFGKFISFFTPNIFFSLKKDRGTNSVILLNKDNLNLVDSFWEETKHRYPIMFVRNKDFIKWRYIDIPIRKYTMLGYIKNDKLLGYIVLTVRTIEGIVNGMIVDFLVNDDTAIGKALVYSCFKIFHEQNVELVGCLMLEHAFEYKVLKSCGFIKCPKALEPQPFPLVFRAHKCEYDTDEMKKITNWFITMGDYDAI